MKTRNDFVSNSSSSSFIVITNSGKYDTPAASGNTVVLPTELGCTEYGWQTQQYRKIYDKLNWCALILRDKYRDYKNASAKEEIKEDINGNFWLRYKAMRSMFRRVCKKAGLRVEFKRGWFDGRAYVSDGYIDHQSDIYERPENGRMFETDEKLFDFIFNSGSYIDNSNDNGGRDDDNCDEYGNPLRPKDYAV